MQRYFINSENLILTEEQIRHLKKVMRSRLGDHFEVVFQNKVYLMIITSLDPFEYQKEKEIIINNELNVDITLLYCLPKGEKLELVLQKATEIGVNHFILLQSSRCISKITPDYHKKLARFQKIILESAEQSKRNKLPDIIDICDFNQINKFHFDYSLIAYENEKTKFLNDFQFQKNQSIGIIIGPEGGFSKEEILFAEKNNFQSISLGKRILRSETACLTSLSILAYLTENL